MTTLNTHHIVQRGLRDDRFFRLGVGDGAWIEARGNLINLTTVEGTAASSMTPLHASNHGAILDGQRQLLEKFLTDRKYNGKTVEDLFNDQLTPNLDPVLKAQI